MKPSVSVAILCHASEPDVAGTLVSVIEACRDLGERRAEIVLLVNGASKLPSDPLLAARAQCTAERISAVVEAVETPACDPLGHGLVARLVESCHGGKAWAWNRAWEKARGEIVVFCDADVRLARESIVSLCQALEQSPKLSAVSATPVPILPTASSFVARASALRYQFEMSNIFGALYAVRASAAPYPMPEEILFEDAWLTARLGACKIGRQPAAKAMFIPAASIGDYFWERVRTEAGKLQIAGTVQNGLKSARCAYPWREFFTRFSASDYLLAGFSLAVRLAASAWARLEMRRGDPNRLWRNLRSTKTFPSTGCLGMAGRACGSRSKTASR